MGWTEAFRELGMGANQLSHTYGVIRSQELERMDREAERAFRMQIENSRANREDKRFDKEMKFQEKQFDATTKYREGEQEARTARDEATATHQAEMQRLTGLDKKAGDAYRAASLELQEATLDETTKSRLRDDLRLTIQPLQNQLAELRADPLAQQQPNHQQQVKALRLEIEQTINRFRYENDMMTAEEKAKVDEILAADPPESPPEATAATGEMGADKAFRASLGPGYTETGKGDLRNIETGDVVRGTGDPAKLGEVRRPGTPPPTPTMQGEPRMAAVAASDARQEVGASVQAASDSVKAGKLLMVLSQQLKAGSLDPSDPQFQEQARIILASVEPEEIFQRYGQKLYRMIATAGA